MTVRVRQSSNTYLLKLPCSIVITTIDRSGKLSGVDFGELGSRIVDESRRVAVAVERLALVSRHLLGRLNSNREGFEGWFGKVDREVRNGPIWEGFGI